MKSKRPLRFVVSGALLVGSLSACGANNPPPNEPRPTVNEAEHGPETNDPEPNEGAHTEVEPEPEVLTNTPPPEPTVNEVPDVEDVEE